MNFMFKKFINDPRFLRVPHCQKLNSSKNRAVTYDDQNCKWVSIDRYSNNNNLQNYPKFNLLRPNSSIVIRYPVQTQIIMELVRQSNDKNCTYKFGKSEPFRLSKQSFFSYSNRKISSKMLSIHTQLVKRSILRNNFIYSWAREPSTCRWLSQKYKQVCYTMS